MGLRDMWQKCNDMFFLKLQKCNDISKFYVFEYIQYDYALVLNVTFFF
jgi:hypothetical protein